jgi:hypothetical protein
VAGAIVVIDTFEGMLAAAATHSAMVLSGSGIAKEPPTPLVKPAGLAQNTVELAHDAGKLVGTPELPNSSRLTTEQSSKISISASLLELVLSADLDTGRQIPGEYLGHVQTGDEQHAVAKSTLPPGLGVHRHLALPVLCADDRRGRGAGDGDGDGDAGGLPGGDCVGLVLIVVHKPSWAHRTHVPAYKAPALAK